MKTKMSTLPAAVVDEISCVTTGFWRDTYVQISCVTFLRNYFSLKT